MASPNQNLNITSAPAVTLPTAGLDYGNTQTDLTNLTGTKGSLDPNSMKGGNTTKKSPVKSPVIITAKDAQKKVDNATAGINAIPVQEKPKTTIDYNNQIEKDIIPEQERLYSNELKELSDVKNGVIKYSADEQATINNIEQSIANARASQELVNRQAERGTALLDVGEFAPVRGLSAMQQTLQSGISQLKTIDMEGASKLAEARTAIRDRKFNEIVKTYSELNGMMDRRNKTLQDLRTSAMDLEKFAYQQKKDARDYALDLQKFNLDKENIYSQIAERNAKNSNTNFVTPPVIDPKTGVANPTAWVASVIKGSGAKDNTNLQNVIGVVASAQKMANANKGGQFKGLGPVQGVGGQAITKGKGIDNRGDLAALELKVQTWASGASLTEQQTKQVMKMVPQIGDTDFQVRTKLNNLTNTMLGVTTGYLASQGISTESPTVDLFSPAQKQVQEETSNPWGEVTTSIYSDETGYIIPTPNKQ
jgi:hypothetical protein